MPHIKLFLLALSFYTRLPTPKDQDYTQLPQASIYLPLVGDAQASRTESVRPDGDYTMLVVDDCDFSRTLATEVLSRDRYNLLEAKNGDEALSIAQGFPVRSLL